MGGKMGSKSQKMYCGAKCLFLNLTGVFSFLGLLGCAAAGALYIFMVEETEDILQLIALVGTAMCLFTLVINATIMCNCLCCSSGNEKKRRVWFTLFFLLTAAVAVLQVIEDPKETSLAACEEIQCPAAESVTPTDCPDDEDQVYKSCLADNANRDNVDDSNRVFIMSGMIASRMARAYAASLITQKNAPSTNTRKRTSIATVTAPSNYSSLRGFWLWRRWFSVPGDRSHTSWPSCAAVTRPKRRIPNKITQINFERVLVGPQFHKRSLALVPESHRKEVVPIGLDTTSVLFVQEVKSYSYMSSKRRSRGFIRASLPDSPFAFKIEVKRTP